LKNHLARAGEALPLLLERRTKLFQRIRHDANIA
jgi:hypothetical protein